MGAGDLTRRRWWSTSTARLARALTNALEVLTSVAWFAALARLSPKKGAIGFDGDDGLVAAYRGAQAHVKTRAQHDCER